MGRILILSIAAIYLSGCAGLGVGPKYTAFPSCTEFSMTDTCVRDDEPRMIAVFFDGTGNTEESRSNIAKLHNIVTLRDTPYVHTLYVQGVGTDRKILGGAVGAGFDDRVKLAYHFIASKYRAEKGDKIFLFGFSRGAYSARALAGMMYTADLPDFGSMPDQNAQKALVEEIFAHYKGSDSLVEKREALKNISGYRPRSTNIRISFMGLFDTVSALSYQPNEERKLGELSGKYLDQICNVDKVAHAMSIDDNRGRAFSPVPMTVSAIASTCEEVAGLSGDARATKVGELIDERVVEVWFSGAHSDVGGGYAQNDDLSGVPLNWMMRQIKKSEATVDLLPEHPFVYEDIHARSHVGEDALLGGRVYVNKNRAIGYYSEQLHPTGRPLVIHSSVIARRATVPRTCREYDFSQQSIASTQSEDKCYSNHQTPTFKGFGECFEKVPLKDETLRDNRLLADFALRFTCPDEGPLLVVDEPERYR